MQFVFADENIGRFKPVNLGAEYEADRLKAIDMINSVYSDAVQPALQLSTRDIARLIAESIIMNEQDSEDCKTNPFNNISEFLADIYLIRHFRDEAIKEIISADTLQSTKQIIYSLTTASCHISAIEELLEKVEFIVKASSNTEKLKLIDARARFTSYYASEQAH